MKYFSDKVNKVFDTVEELEAAEKEQEEKEAEKTKLVEVKKSRAKEVEDAYLEYENVKEKAYKEIAEAEDKWIQLRDKFAEDYNGYHMTYVNKNGEKKVTFDDLVNSFYDSFFDR